MSSETYNAVCIVVMAFGFVIFGIGIGMDRRKPPVILPDLDEGPTCPYCGAGLRLGDDGFISCDCPECMAVFDSNECERCKIIFTGSRCPKCRGAVVWR